MIKKIAYVMLMGTLYITVSLLLACGNDQVKPTIDDNETTVTQYSYNHTMVYSGNGNKSYRMYALEIKRFELASEPYTLYPKGIRVETFDSTGTTIDSRLTANWAKYNEKMELWEAKGDVVAINFSGNRKLETQQLFWDEKTGKIYTSQNARVYDNDDIFNGVGFETDQDFDSWQFNQSYGRMTVEQNDSTANKTQNNSVKSSQ